MIKKALPLLFLLMFIITGCSVKTSGTEFKGYLEEMGMEIISISEKQTVTLDATDKTHRSILAVQERDDLDGKDVEIHIYEVKNHPIQKMKPEIEDVEVSLLIVDNEIVGGFTVADGYYYSLDGTRADVTVLYGN
jgi:hypothetical protein